jgi:hypothetical protein
MAGQNTSILGVCDILGLPRPEYLENMKIVSQSINKCEKTNRVIINPKLFLLPIKTYEQCPDSHRKLYHFEYNRGR